MAFLMLHVFSNLVQACFLKRFFITFSNKFFIRLFPKLETLF